MKASPAGFLRRSLVLLLLAAAACAAAQTSSRASQSTNVRRNLASPDIPRDSSDPAHHMLLGTSEVRAFRVDVAPHATTSSAHHAHDYFVVAIRPGKLRILEGGQEFPFEMQRGDMQILKGGFPHRVVNDSGEALQVVEVELTRAIDPEHAFCGTLGRACSDTAFGRSERGNYSRTMVMETGSVRVHRVQLDPGVELPNYSLRSDGMIVALSELTTLTLHLQPGDAGWASRGARLANSGTIAAEFLLLELK
jgi:quercetin dioxygenase-like cupin family protein